MESSTAVPQEMERIERQIAKELNLRAERVHTVIHMLDEGNTIPFIARYRKEKTGEMDETTLRNLSERLQYLRNLEERKQEVIRLIDEQGKLTEELQQAITKADKLQVVEDLYRPYKQKRKTRASVAKEKGLEPLSEWLLSQPSSGDPEAEASRFVDEEKGVETSQDALQGAMDILAERISDDPSIRAWVRQFSYNQGAMVTEAKDAEADSVYEMYYEYKEPVKRLPSHRILAINRGEKEEFLKVQVEVPVDRILEHIQRQVIKGNSVVREILEAVIEDAYKRLIAPSIERDVRNELTEKAEEQAIKIFSENLRNLLLQPPVHGKTVLGVDPAFRTGCKLAVVDETGKVLDIAVTYPTAPHHKTEEAERIFRQLIEKHNVEIIAIGNGTASRETEQFVSDLISRLPERSIQYIIVNEAGASVYSASKLAQEEFPDYDVSERSAVSIARRLQDPLAELVKIDPKSIGVGQYQHDVNAKRLSESLGAVVESVVNHVGVDLNTASPSLLSYVAGINQTIARNIVKYRDENGKFTSRSELKKVPRLGAKTYEQSVGFIRIPGGVNPLDNTPIHPESYKAVDQLLQGMGMDKAAIGTADLRDKLQEVQPEALVNDELEIGLPTIKDIIASLLRPGRDPREELPPPIFQTGILQLEDLKPGMELKGTVRNVIDFGAFVDIGLKNDGLVHISELSEKFVNHPMDVVSVGDTVTVWVLTIDEKRGRVGLTMKPSSVTSAASSTSST